MPLPMASATVAMAMGGHSDAELCTQTKKHIDGDSDDTGASDGGADSDDD